MANGQKENAMNTVEIARAIYTEIFGDIDDKNFKADKVGEIEAWLQEGDLAPHPDWPNKPTIQMVDEWRVYDAEEIGMRFP